VRGLTIGKETVLKGEENLDEKHLSSPDDEFDLL